MTRSIVSALLGLLSVAALGSLPAGCQSGGIGDPCTPEEEYNPQFAGFKVTEENIESRSFQCETRICLVNHFQGRVSCPYGQDPIVEAAIPGRHACTPDNTSACGNGESCVEAAALAITCDPEKPDQGSGDCAGYGNNCNPEGRFCQCATTADCLGAGPNFICDGNDFHCKSYVCHAENNCQNPNLPPDRQAENKGKDCCVPGSDTPVTAPVCGQCDTASRRNAESAVYCSCRCGVAEGEVDDGTFNFCECPTSYVCEEIRKNVGLGDEQITGKYCIKEGSKFESETKCGKVEGKKFASCAGVGSGG
jgi:hypothetical protein